MLSIDIRDAPESLCADLRSSGSSLLNSRPRKLQTHGKRLTGVPLGSSVVIEIENASGRCSLLDLCKDLHEGFSFRGVP